MDSKKIDQQFDQALERIRDQKGPLQPLYHTGALADDHFMLQKSWVYFKGRVKSIETQWEDIVKAKDEALRAVQVEMESLKARMGELEAENKTLKTLEERVEDFRLGEIKEFEKKSESFKMSWIQEKETLEMDRSILENKVKNLGDQIKERRQAYEKREADFLGKIEELKTHTADVLEKQLRAQNESLEILKRKDEEIHLLDSKHDLLKGEIERRDEVLKRYEDDIKHLKSEIDIKDEAIDGLNFALGERNQDLHNLKLRVDILEKERDMVRASWSQEQAEWRQLWDRAREIWEKDK